jgi:hypothetical protein
MAHLHLPAQHTDDDLALAGALAQVLRSEELYVAWSFDGGAAEPCIPARLQAPDVRPFVRERRPSLLARIVRALFAPTVAR